MHASRVHMHASHRQHRLTHTHTRMPRQVYQCRWRGLDCVAKMLADGAEESSRENKDKDQEMINELSTVSHLRPTYA